MDPLVAHSQDTIARGSKSFALAARLFDRRTRARALLLYAWCRHCDDEIDGQDLGARPQQPVPALQARRLEILQHRTRSALSGEPQSEPAFAGLQRVVHECRIPHRYPLELLEGFAMDVRGARYRHLDDTLRYCYHVAGTVGAMMARVMGVQDAAILMHGIHLGLGLQLTNIARDVMDDARAGRVYLPGEWLEQEHVSPTPDGVLAHPTETARVARRLLDAAAPYYISARLGMTRLPFRSAWAVNAAACIYRDIGTIVRARGSAAWSARASVPKPRKLALLLTAGAEVGRLKLRSSDQLPAPSGLWEPAEPADIAYPSKR